MSKVHEILKKHTIGDGHDIVVCPYKSHGSWVHDKQTGKEYLDCYSQFASMPIGWNHPKLAQHTHRLGLAAINKIANSDMYCDEYAEFVEEFASVCPDFKHFFFIDGGALAVENALKAAFDWKLQKNGWSHDYMANKLDVIHLEHAFHGRTGYTLSLTNTNPDKIHSFPKFNWTRLRSPMGHRKNHELSLAQADAAMRTGNVAAVIAEPIQGEGGDNHLPGDYIRDLWSIAQKHDTLFIVDEVQTGVGLTGKMWAYEHFRVRGFVPDMMCFGKKSQVCGVAAGPKLDEVKNNVFRTSSRINSTWGGNIVDMVRFNIISKIIKEDKLVDNAAEVGAYFLEKLAGTFENARGRGLMLAFDLPSTDKRDAYYDRVSEKMMVLKSGDKSIRLRPALTFSKADADKAMEFLVAAK